jgi:hypothetical protein
VERWKGGMVKRFPETSLRCSRRLARIFEGRKLKW